MSVILPAGPVAGTGQSEMVSMRAASRIAARTAATGPARPTIVHRT
jgi:hypothetical protein